MYKTYIVLMCSDFIIDKSDNSKFHCMPPMANFVLSLYSSLRSFHPISIRQPIQSIFFLLLLVSPSSCVCSGLSFSRNLRLQNYRNQKRANEFILKFIQIEKTAAFASIQSDLANELLLVCSYQYHSTRQVQIRSFSELAYGF